MADFHDIEAEISQTPLERRIAELAARQHGVIALWQFRELGLSASAVHGRASAGRLHRIHTGVYAVGHSVLAVHGRWMAAVLACGHGAVLSHRSAAALWGLRESAQTGIEITTRRRNGRTRAGIQVHSGATLTPAHTTTHRGIPCTTVARTLLDIADVTNRRGLERALDQAEILRLLDADELQRLLVQAGRGRRGAAILQDLLADHHPGDTITRSELEERFLALCAATGVPRPRVNAWIALPGGAVQADFLWTEQLLVVETDGHAAHGTRAAFERDRRRDQRLLLAGWRVVRFTWRQVTRRPEQLRDALQALLA